MTIWFPPLALVIGLAMWLPPWQRKKIGEFGGMLVLAALIVCLWMLASDALVVSRR